MNDTDNPGSRARALTDAMERAEYRRVPISELVRWERNPRTITEADAERLATGISAVETWGADVLVQAGTNRVIGGHLRLLAAERLGLEAVPCKILDVDDARADELALLDNRAAEFAEWEPSGLRAILEELAPERRAAVGWNEAELVTFLAGFAPPETEEEDPPEPPKKPRTRPGDLWLLGDHRLLCGDCRESADVAYLVGSDEVAVAFTSPPYSSQRRYDEESGFRPIPPDGYLDWWDAVQANVRDHLAEDGSFFVNIKPHSDGLDTALYVLDLVAAMVRRWDWHFAAELCWERSGVPGKAWRRFKNQFEPVYQFALGEWKFRPDAVRVASDSVPTYSPENHLSDGLHDGTAGRAGKGWANAPPGFAYPGNRLRPFGSGSGVGHPAGFPVGLPMFFVRAYSDLGDAVFDPFVGSGTTIIACENESRRGLGMEVSPDYCDLVLARWEALTGQRAKRARKARTK